MCDYILPKSGMMIDMRSSRPSNGHRRYRHWYCEHSPLVLGISYYCCCVVFVELMISCSTVVVFNNCLETEVRLTEGQFKTGSDFFALF